MSLSSSSSDPLAENFDPPARRRNDTVALPSPALSSMSPSSSGSYNPISPRTVPLAAATVPSTLAASKPLAVAVASSPRALSLGSPASGSSSSFSSITAMTSSPAPFALDDGKSAAASTLLSSIDFSLDGPLSPGADDEDLDDDDDDTGSSARSPSLGGLSSPSGNAPKQGFGLSFKKFLASKTAKSSLGRKVIAAFLGDEGNKTLTALKDAVEKHKGSAVAKDVKTTILRMAIKAKLLQDARLITKRDVWLMADPINNLAIQSYFAFKPRMTSVVRENEVTGEGEEIKTGPVDVAPLVAEFKTVKELCAGLLKNHMKADNSAKLTSTFEYLGGADFLSALVSNPKFEEEKHVIYSSLRKIVQPLLIERKYDNRENQICSVDGCGEFVAEGGGVFRGSNKCLLHHEDAVNAFVAVPNVTHFLTGDGKDYWPFQKMCKNGTQRYLRKLYLVLLQYRAAKPALKGVFADEICKKYLRKGASHRVTVPDKTLEYAETLISAKEFHTCFDDIRADLLKVLEAFFVKDWVKSVDQKEYIQCYKLPPFLQKECNKMREEKKKKEKETKDKEKELAKEREKENKH